jgi:hypothetical protein
VIAIPIVTLAQASCSYMSRMLRNGMLALFVNACLGTVAAHAQSATWLLSPGSGNWNTAANWVPATVPTGTATFKYILDRKLVRRRRRSMKGALSV